jgi:O-acetyl-ADP-ribose deacetylase (regulator of RNase III)
MVKIIVGDICYPKSSAIIIPANTTGTMLRGRSAQIARAGLSGIMKEAKLFVANNKIKPGDCFSTGPGRLNRRGLKKIYHAVIKRLQSDFTSAYIVREALSNSLKMVELDKIESVTICGLGIGLGELDPIVAAGITAGQINKFAKKIEIKVIDENQEFINELNRIVGKGMKS